MSDTWEILDGLPAYGPAAQPFSATGFGTHSEGVVVKFLATSGEWMGNFQRGMSSCDEVFQHPDGRHLVVVAGGTAYVVDPEARLLARHFGAQIEHVIPIPGEPLVLLSNGLWLEALDARGTAWRSRRISWDGFRGLALDGHLLRGEAYAPEGVDGAWYGFEVDVRSGEVTGGSYSGPPM